MNVNLPYKLPGLSALKLILLDRDGVINVDSEHYIRSPAEWIPISGSLSAIARLNQLGLKVAVVSNQSGLARGYFSEATLEAIHTKMNIELASVGGHLDNLFFCPHHPQDKCHCRKPDIGLLQQAFTYFDIPPTQTLLIGDSITDLQAAQTAGCYAALVKTGKGTQTLETHSQLSLPVYENLADLVADLVA